MSAELDFASNPFSPVDNTTTVTPDRGYLTLTVITVITRSFQFFYGQPLLVGRTMVLTVDDNHLQTKIFLVLLIKL